MVDMIIANWALRASLAIYLSSHIQLGLLEIHVICRLGGPYSEKLENAA